MIELDKYGKLSAEQKQIAQKIYDAAMDANVDPSLAIAVGYQENRLRQGADSPKGAVGVMQVMPATAKSIGIDPRDLKNVDTNIRAGIQILKNNLDMFEGNSRLALIGYNAGPKIAVKFAKAQSDKVLPDETKDYLVSINEHHPLDAEGITMSEKDTESEKKGFKYFDEPDPLPPHIEKLEKELSQQKDTTGTAVWDLTKGLTDFVTDNPEVSLPAAGLASGIHEYRANAPKTGPGINLTEEQFNRVLQGGQEDGMTGRARMRYNDITSMQSQEARNAQERIKALERSGVRGVGPQQTSSIISQSGATSATPSGVMAPPEAVSDYEKVQRELDAIERNRLRRPLDAILEGSRQTISAATSPRAWARGASRIPLLASPLSGVNAAAQYELAKERWNKGEYLGAIPPAVGGAGATLSMIPATTGWPGILRGAGLMMQAGEVPLEMAYRAYRDQPKQEPTPPAKQLKKADGGYVPLSLKDVYFHRKARG